YAPPCPYTTLFRSYTGGNGLKRRWMPPSRRSCSIGEGTSGCFQPPPSYDTETAVRSLGDCGSCLCSRARPFGMLPAEPNLRTSALSVRAHGGDAAIE